MMIAVSVVTVVNEVGVWSIDNTEHGQTKPWEAPLVYITISNLCLTVAQKLEGTPKAYYPPRM